METRLSSAKGLTLIELLACSAILVALAAMVIPASLKLKRSGESAKCAHSLRQLSVATQLYVQDHNGFFFPYYEEMPDGSKRWYFGSETASSMGQGEGDREVDITDGPLYPYLNIVGSVEICPAFPYGSNYWKPKFKGASFGYGYNQYLSPPTQDNPRSPRRPKPISIASIEKPSQVIVFGDCAQVNDFQAPASASNPLLEEFYSIDDTYKTIHFRHSGRANMLFVDGHVEAFEPEPNTLDSRLPSEIIGRITPRGSTKYLK